MDTQKNEDLLRVYHNFKQLFFYNFSIDQSAKYMNESIMAYGTHVDERVNNIEDFNHVLRLQREQSDGLELQITEIPVLSKTLSGEEAHLFVEELQLQMKVDGEYITLPLRLTTVLEYKDKRWTITHFHGSNPQGNEGDEDTWHANKLKEENERLEKVVMERTNELNVSLENLKSTQTQLIHAEKMASLGELTAGIAHEIQNPLNFVNNFSDVSAELIDEMNEEIDKQDFEEVKAINADLKDNLIKINHHGKRADAIVKGMLEHSRTNSGERVSTDLNAQAEEFLRLSYHGIRAKDKHFNSNFKLDLDPTLPNANVIPQDFGRVLLNLINNAFYAVSERCKTDKENYQPVVIVSTKYLSAQDNKTIVISIKDNGNGIPENIKEKIFQPFFTTKPTGSGTGLGLSLAYDIVKAHGGELKVESQEGNGTEFSISIPFGHKL